jgi:monoamine oxidase
LIGGDHSFRLANGYQAIPFQLLAGTKNAASKLRLNCVVERIQWRAGSIAIQIRNGEVLHARRAIITVPLGILQAEDGAEGAIHFDPEPSEILEAARSLRFGQVFRVVLRFREAFWEADERFADAGFLLSDEPLFPTWWTTLAVRAPILTGWSAGPHTDALLGKSHAEIISSAIGSLAHTISRREQELNRLIEAAYFHDWHADPFARGAYSYVPAGALPARKKLAQPVSDTLFLAGEATDQNGHSATVHGAIASGVRAAHQVLETYRL